MPVPQAPSGDNGNTIPPEMLERARLCAAGLITEGGQVSDEIVEDARRHVQPVTTASEPKRAPPPLSPPTGQRRPPTFNLPP